MKHSPYLLILFFIFSIRLQAQRIYNNSFEYSTSDFSIPGKQKGILTIDDRLRTEQFGFYYKRKVDTSFGLAIGYAQWNNHYDGFDDHHPYYVFGGYIPNLGPGSLLKCQSFRMVDFEVSKFFNLYKRKHFINAGLGVSYFWGQNEYVGTIYYNPDPPYDMIITNTEKQVNYFGLFPHLGYEFFFLKNRLNTGIDFRYRLYFNSPIAKEFEYGLHIGINF